MENPAEATGAEKPEDDIVKTTFRLPREAFTEFKAAAAFNNETMSAAITKLMQTYAEDTERRRAARRKK